MEYKAMTSAMMDQFLYEHASHLASNDKDDESKIENYIIKNMDLRRICLCKNIFLNVKMEYLNLSGANFVYAKFINCDIFNVNFTNTSLR
jgi:uncharacterized protein YjbI with pentapeptide repeats